MNGFIINLLISGVAAVLFMSVVFLVARRLRRYDLVDAAWGWVFIVITVSSFMLQPGEMWQLDIQTLVVFLVGVWGIRLSQHIVRRIIATETEDHRYVELRSKWRGNMAWNTYTRVYLLQALLAVCILIPVIFINSAADYAVNVLAVVGLAIWLVGFTIEAISDRQLRTFVASKENKGTLMQTGLWKYSRHPNYFGEITQWWGVFIVALTVPLGWLTIVGPALITYLICFVSGIPLAEKGLQGRSGWKEYKNRTSILIPMPRWRK